MNSPEWNGNCCLASPVWASQMIVVCSRTRNHRNKWMITEKKVIILTLWMHCTAQINKSWMLQCTDHVFDPLRLHELIKWTTWMQWEFLLIWEGSNAHWCSRRKNHALRAGGWKLFEFEDQGKFNLFCLLGNM